MKQFGTGSTEESLAKAARLLEQSAGRVAPKRELPGFLRRNAPFLFKTFIFIVLLQAAYWLGLNWANIKNAVER